MRIVKLAQNLTESEKNKEMLLIKNKFPASKTLGNTDFIHVDENISLNDFTDFQHVQEIIENVPAYALSSRQLMPCNTSVSIGGKSIGTGENLFIIAGPCSVESYDQLAIIAESLINLNIGYMRAGAYKPRTSPYSFQGLKQQGLEIMFKIKQDFGLKMVTEVMSSDKIDEVSEVADVLQVGSRNMLHYAFLEQLGKQQTPVLLKRGMSAGLDEFLLSAEYILCRGNHNVILCERGIKTFETATRNTLDLSVVPNIKNKSHLPIIVDPSHGTGHRNLVEPMSLAAIACGADGLEIEVHNNPDKAWSDGQQCITPDEFAVLMSKIQRLREK